MKPKTGITGARSRWRTPNLFTYIRPRQQVSELCLGSAATKNTCYQSLMMTSRLIPYHTSSQPSSLSEICGPQPVPALRGVLRLRRWRWQQPLGLWRSLIRPHTARLNVLLEVLQRGELAATAGTECASLVERLVVGTRAPRDGLSADGAAVEECAGSGHLLMLPVRPVPPAWLEGTTCLATCGTQQAVSRAALSPSPSPSPVPAPAIAAVTDTISQPASASQHRRNQLIAAIGAVAAYRRLSHARTTVRLMIHVRATAAPRKQVPSAVAGEKNDEGAAAPD